MLLNGIVLESASNMLKQSKLEKAVN